MFAHQQEPTQQQEVNVMVKRSDSQTSFTIPKEEEFEIVKKSESSTPPDFEVIQLEQEVAPVEEPNPTKQQPVQQEIPIIIETSVEQYKEQQPILEV